MCTSFTDFLRKYGGLNRLSTLAADGSADTWAVETTDSVVQGYYAVKGYFDEKLGSPQGVAFICRTVKSSGGATAATRTFSDGAANNTTATSKWKGTPGGTTSVQVDNPSPDKGTGWAKLTVRNSQDCTNVSVKSELITVTLPAGGQLPQTSVAKKLGNGTPGTADAYNATASDMIGTVDSSNNKTGLQAFSDFRYGLGFVAIPGFTATGATAIAAGLKTHCETFFRTGLIGSSAGLNKSTVGADLGSTASNYLAYYTPRIKVADQNSDAGGTLTIDPVGHIAGLGARMDAKYNGPHKSPAGIDNSFTSVVDVERTSSLLELYDDAASGVLADGGSSNGPINTIRIKKGGVTVWGLRTLATDLRYRQINVGRVVGLSYWTCYMIGEPKTFEPIDPDGNLFAKVRGEVYSFLFQLRRNGSLYGDFPGSDPKSTDAFAVVCDKGNNPDINVGAGILTVDIAIAPTPNAEQIKFNLLVGQPGNVVARTVSGT
jgi:phage tail sheath protein FI